MIDALVVSQIALWIVVLALAATVVALARQIGVLHERIAPMGALTIDRGPKVGEQAPRFDLTDLAARPVTLGGPAEADTLILFVSPTCPVCKKLIPIAKSIVVSEPEALRLVFASDGEGAEQERFAREQRIEPYPLVLSGELGMRYRVSKLPYAVLIDEAGVVRAKGLVNTREHLESMLEAKRMGIASIQDYMKTITPPGPSPSPANGGGATPQRDRNG